MPRDGELARQDCANRTKEELIGYAPQRPLAQRDVWRIAGMRARCEACGACPQTIRALTIMSPPEPERPTAEIVRLAG